ncbi:hypothetical protein GALL_329740 [mine drainage metagenome]|jgi:pimeloyl-ACP methyl ester carboxylesterase|uniref:Alpha/beta hydrolase family protein n=1 Tax=mine drainage metagenome TaxID=410659 RepID=A0A1J5QNP7_9ZZZZ
MSPPADAAGNTTHDGNLGVLRYRFQLAPRADAGAGLLVAVHGVRRNAAEQWDAFAEQARQAPCHLLVPCFDEKSYPDYQRLGRPERGQRADLHLIALVARLADQHGFDPADLRLFGHSGGAQFVHRFVMAHPELVHRYALSAAGWYTFPDDTLDYPLGTHHLPARFPRFDPQRYLRVPGRVFVGEREHAQSPLLRRGDAVDTAQGCDRRDRARRWVGAMREAARTHAMPPVLDLVELPDAAHSFRAMVKRTALAARVIDYLFPTDSGAADRPPPARDSHAIQPRA